MSDAHRSDADSVSRRGFVKGAAATAAIATVGGFWFEGFGDPTRRQRVEPTKPGAPLRHFDELQFRTVTAVTDRLLPSSGPSSPGARDVNAAGYLDAVLAVEPITDESKQRIALGLKVADDRARERFGVRELSELSPDKQDDVMRLFETHTHGVYFLRLMLEFTLECFFGDPVHGGNVDQIGWKWAQHRPGSPRPSQPNWRPEETA